uniref:penicillin-binding transpeptidase domain-containing protein n=1 Tax=Agathobacter sp. TaxID=2021311 RepID=UPI004056EBE2
MIYDLKDFLSRFFKSRLFVLSAVMILMFGTILFRVFSLQVVNGEEYQENFEMRIEKTLSVNAARGNIYDCNGKLLAYNELAYSVTISDNGTYEDGDRNEILNAQLAEVVEVLAKNGEQLYNDFKIDLNEDGSYSFNVSGSQLKRFLADVFGKSSYDDLEYNKDFGFDEANATAEQVMEFLMKDENCFEIDDSYSRETAYGITIIRYAMRSTFYTRYQTTTIAQDVSDKTVAYINEHSDRLIGIEIKEDTIRKYNDSIYFASMIGYTGKISDSEYKTLSATDESYSTNDSIGKAGLEQYYESYLRGRNGEQVVYVDTLGRIRQVMKSSEPEAGNDLYLSVDADLQKATYLLLEQEIAGIVYSNIQSGKIPVNDVYFALLDNNVIDITQFDDEDATATEQAVYQNFLVQQSNAIAYVKSQLYAQNPLANNDMSEEMLDYFTYVITLLKNDQVLLSSEIDTSDSIYKKWRDGKISPKEYLTYGISKQWIDISLLEVNDKYADTSEIYDALCSYIETEAAKDKEFSKYVYKYMVEKNQITGRELCLLLFEQGALDYDDDTYNRINNGNIRPYNFILEKINYIEITPAQLALDPCTGSCVITDVKTGEIKALVSYPGYDNNRLANGVDAEYYAGLNEDNSNPQWNYATQEKTAPGSTFKLLTSTAGLAENVISTSTPIYCDGVFDEVTNRPKCWIYPGGTHQQETLSEAIKDSCNIYFYTTGYMLSTKDTGVYNDANGIEYLTKYGEIYGLDEKTGLEIVESTSELADEYPVMAAIGQSNNNITTAALSRYVTAVSTGKLYNYQLMNKIVDPEGNVLESYSSEYEDISGTLSANEWSAIRYGMRLMCQDNNSFKNFPIAVAGKTGTAQQVSTRPNHALFVGYAPYDNPEISIATRIAYGYSSSNAAAVSKNILSYYFKTDTLENILSLHAEGANSSSNNSVTD